MLAASGGGGVPLADMGIAGSLLGDTPRGKEGTDSLLGEAPLGEAPIVDGVAGYMELQRMLDIPPMLGEAPLGEAPTGMEGSLLGEAPGGKVGTPSFSFGTLGFLLPSAGRCGLPGVPLLGLC